jgi:hypothetical protein
MGEEWEYMTVFTDREEDLNVLGERGWEVIQKETIREECNEMEEEVKKRLGIKVRCQTYAFLGKCFLCSWRRFGQGTMHEYPKVYLKRKKRQTTLKTLPTKSNEEKKKPQGTFGVVLPEETGGGTFGVVLPEETG